MQQPVSTVPKLFVVIGDVHANISLVVYGLEMIEAELGRSIDQVFSVGDLGLFLEEADWNFLSGPKKHRHPERTPEIRRAWDAWRWPLTMIGGNHEPWHKLRDFKPGDFGPWLSFTVAGVVPHVLDGFHAYGLSGIFHPDHLDFHTANESASGSARATKWADLIHPGQFAGQVTPKQLTYYKQEELGRLLSLPAEPHLLLLHDWPKIPAETRENFQVRPERELVESLRPEFVCCGHHHRPEAFRMGRSECRALNIIQDREAGDSWRIGSGWAWIGEWDAENGSLSEVGYWPPLTVASANG